MLRATLKSLLSRKLRLVLSGMAIVLGIAFVAGAFVLTDSLGQRFENLFRTVNQNTDAAVVPTDESIEDGEPPLLTEAERQRLERIDGVATANGEAWTLGVVPFKKNGRPFTTSGAPQLGFGITPDDLDGDFFRVADGELPDREGEVVLNRFTANGIDARVGDRIKIYITPIHEAREFTVVGIMEYEGGRESLGGETFVGFVEPEAQRLFFGRTDVFAEVTLTADPGVSQHELVRRVAAAVPAEFEAKTGEQVTEDQVSELKFFLNIVNWVFLGFAGVSLFVGIFLIFNTFNILVAQRARELAIYRALGAKVRQVITAVLLEAVVVGLIGATLGLLAGVGIALGLQALMQSFGVELPEGGTTVLPRTIVVSYAVGLVVTVVAAMIPAIRASRVSPLAAMRDVVRPDKPLRRLTIAGLTLFMPGAVLTGVALAGAGDNTGWFLLGGVVLLFLGAALLSPIAVRPVAGLIGRALSWGAASQLGRRNALRNPRRTAVTASALMIGVTLVTAAGVMAASLSKTIKDVIENQLGADVIIDTQFNDAPTGKEGFDPARLDEVRRIPGVEQAMAVHVTMARIDGGERQFVAAVDLALAEPMFGLKRTEGELRGVADNEALVDDATARSFTLDVGDTVTVDLAKGQRTFHLVGIYEASVGGGGLLLPLSAARDFAGQAAAQGYVKLAPGTDVDQVVDRIETILADYPLVTVTDRSGLVKQSTDAINVTLGIVYTLLALAVIIAILGIINTLALSVYERIRELGLLRAVGMARRQVKRMVRVESVIIAVYGCLLGIALGVGLGAATAYALKSIDFFTAVAMPSASLVVFVGLAAVAGVVAAWWPAFRASRLNVLEAIAYE